MDNVKVEATEQNSQETADVFAEKIACFLEDDDIQCGHVAYNDQSRVLKFTCTFCHKTYDDIEYFCQHLSEHINTFSEHEEEEPLDCKEEENVKLEEKLELDEKLREEETVLEYGNTDFLHNTEDTIYTHGEYNICNSNANSSEIDEKLEDTDNQSTTASDMIIEEIEEDEDSPADYSQESHGTLEEGDNFKALEEEEDSCSHDYIEYEGAAKKVYDNSLNHGNSFEECFLKETNIERIRSEGVCVLKENTIESGPKQRKRIKFQDMLRLRRKRKKVTTVKVIAVKNRIAELYERIRKQQANSQHILASNGLLAQDYLSFETSNMALIEQETQDATETYSTNDEEQCNAMEENPNAARELGKSDLTRKIIGETLITLIPEGTKIPNTLPPSPAEKKDNKFGFLPAIPKTENYNSSQFDCGNNDKRAVCPACGKTFRSHFSLTIHKRIHYLESDSSVKLAHKCSDCDQLFNKLSQLKLHVEAVHYPEGFVCKICNRKLSSLSLLERHMVRVHLDRPFNCQKCGKNFSDPLTFEKHIISHTSGEIYKCHICGRKYSTEYFLMEHMRNHKEQIPQTCVVCGKVTLRITQHMKIHTPRPKRLLSCSVCGKVFNFSSGLSHHFKIMHKLPRPPPKPKKEPNLNVQKRKRKPRITTNKTSRKKIKQPTSTPNEASFHSSGDIIEEPSEIPDEVYDVEDAETLLQLAPSSASEQRLPTEIKTDGDGDAAAVGCHGSNLQQLLHSGRHHQTDLDEEDVIHKEEEAKRVIVELIQNSTYTSFFPDNLSSVLEVVTPPIAREETISAVNSIVHDC